MTDETDEVMERFAEYHIDNPHVYDLFVKYTFEAIDAGLEKISHWLIINRIRWETDVAASDRYTKFRISNNYIAYYARLFQSDYPEHAYIFNTKRMKGE